MKRVVFVLLGASLPLEVQSVLKLQQPDIPILDKVIDDLAKATDNAKENLKKAGEEHSSRAKENAEKSFQKMKHGEIHKPSMDDIEVMRANLCWNRPNLLQHEDCMKFLLDTCETETSGEGICRKLALYLKHHCANNEQLACDYAKDLKVKIDDDADHHEENEKDTEEVEKEREEIDAKPDPGPSPALAASPGPAPALAPGPAPGPANTGLSMKVVDPGLPEQGYNEHSDKNVMHEDMVTMTKDWRGEWPMMAKSENEAVHDICDDYPDHAWCKLKKSKAARSEYARSHP
jgi:hypothetical protein